MKHLMSLVVVCLVVLCVGCSSMFDNIKSKSFNVGASGIGMKFTSSVDPTTGAVSPQLSFGALDGTIMSHKPGDGTQVDYSVQKSFWTNEVGQKSLRINCKSGIKNLIITDIPGGATTIAVEEHDADVTTEDVSALMYRADVTKQLQANSATVNEKVRINLEKVRKANSENPALKDRMATLKALSDIELGKLKPGNNIADNQLVGDEVTWRALTAKKK